jgi:hypothetical protein
MLLIPLMVNVVLYGYGIQMNACFTLLLASHDI